MLVAVVAASAKTISLLLTKPWAKTPNNIVTKNKPPASLALNCGDDFAVCSLITLVLICFSLYVSARLDDALAISLAPHAIVRLPNRSFCPLKLHAWRTNWRLSVQAVSPCLDVMICVHYCEHSIVHEEFLGTPGDVQEVECYGVSVRRQLALHPRPISRVAKMRQQQAIPVHINHSDRIVRPAACGHLMKDCVAGGCHPNGHFHGHPHEASFPGTCQSLQSLKRLLCIGLWARRFRHRHLHLLRQRNGSRRNKDD